MGRRVAPATTAYPSAWSASTRLSHSAVVEGAWTVATSRRAVAATRGSTSTASLGVSSLPSSANQARCSATRSSAKPYRAGGIGARTAISSCDALAGRHRRREARCESRPRRSRCRARRASGTTPRCRRPSSPRLRSPPRPVPSSALRREAARATTSASVRREARARRQSIPATSRCQTRCQTQGQTLGLTLWPRSTVPSGLGLAAWKRRCSSALAGASRSSGLRSGSCGRRAGRFRSTARSGSATDSSSWRERRSSAREVTLQPVARYGVDAAVLFADIMTPVLAMGVDVQLVEGRGADGGAPVPHRRRHRPPALDHAARGDAGRDSPDPRRAARGQGARRLLRRAVHGRLLPRGGPRQPRLPRGEGAHAPGARRVARAARTARRWLRRLRPGAGRRRRRRDPALRLVGGHSQPRRLRGVRRAVFDPRARSRRRSDDSLRNRHGRAPHADARRRRRRHRARLACGARPRVVGDRRTNAASRAISTRRSCSGRGRTSRRRRETCCAAQAVAPATSSTSATACCRRRIPTCSPG